MSGPQKHELRWRPGDCRASLLEWIVADAVQDLPADARRHATTCADCSDLQPFLEPLPDYSIESTPPPGLADNVLARTASNRCDLALDAWVDREDLDSIERSLLDRHLESCSSCSAVSRALMALERDLPAIRSFDPGPRFTAQVLARTSQTEQAMTAGTRFDWLERLTSRWSEWRSRPRFALEFSYVGAVACWLLISGSGVSVDPMVKWLADTPGLVFGTAGRQAGFLSVSLADNTEAGLRSVDRFDGPVRRLMDDLGDRYEETLEKGSSLAGELAGQLNRLPEQFLQEPKDAEANDDQHNDEPH